VLALDGVEQHHGVGVVGVEALGVFRGLDGEVVLAGIEFEAAEIDPALDVVGIEGAESLVEIVAGFGGKVDGGDIVLGNGEGCAVQGNNDGLPVGAGLNIADEGATIMGGYAPLPRRQTRRQQADYQWAKPPPSDHKLSPLCGNIENRIVNMGGERNKFQDKRHQEAKAALQDSGRDDLKHPTYGR
jgi:hypothetical protein